MTKTTVVEHEAVTNFRKYLRIPTVHPDVDYSECVKFLLDQAKSLSLPSNVYTFHVGKPVVVITWEGKEPSLPSILLNSHTDVVPVTPKKWNYDPFGAEKDKNGNIYARGAQDMKCVGIQYIEAIRRYIKEKLSFKRTIHLSFVPDEEISGKQGMALFINSEEFKQLNVGFALDEGIAHPEDLFFIFNGERSIWHLDVICPGTAGHGSIIHAETAGEKARYVIDKFMDYREEERQKLESNPNLFVGDVTTVNLTMLSGGVQVNVVPSELKITFDVRVAVDVDHDELEKKMNKWCAEAGQDVRIEFDYKGPKNNVTVLDDTNVYWKSFKSSCDKLGIKLVRQVFPGGTDSRYIRNKDIPAIGFSPINNTPVLLHDHNEFLNENVFLKGIDIYYKIIQNLASC